MTKITVLIAEDEKPARDKLSHQLSLIEQIELLDIATTGKEAIDKINQLQPDLVLLDIQMPGFSGLDVLDVIEHKPQIIFTTAFDQYAIRAFEANSTDYLLKPFTLARLKQAIEKACKLQQLSLLQSDNPDAPATTSQQINADFSRLTSKQGDRIFLLKPESVLYFRSEGGITQAWDGNKLNPISPTLNQLELGLDTKGFVRVHRSYLINIEKIKEIQSWFNGKLMLIMQDENNTEISTSRAGADKLRNLLNL